MHDSYLARGLISISPNILCMWSHEHRFRRGMSLVQHRIPGEAPCRAVAWLPCSLDTYAAAPLATWHLRGRKDTETVHRRQMN